MTAYDDLIKELRDPCPHENCVLAQQAADAIEELQKPRWIKFETRPMDEEEREYYSDHYGYNLTDDEAVIYCCQLPEHGQEVLVCGRYGRVWIDTFDDDPDYGIGFEANGDMDGLIAWMPLPAPPKEEEA